MKKFIRFDTFAATAPYLLWMVLMFVLPTSAVSYAVRTFVTFVALFILYPRLSPKAIDARPNMKWYSTSLWGTLVGLGVCLVWVAPEQFEFYRRTLVIGGAESAAAASPYDPYFCGWPLTLFRLVGSAFIIAPAEELFFRSFLYRRLISRDWTATPLSTFDLSAFLWTTGLFALEHDRLLVAILAGAAYNFLAIRKGLSAAILAHVVTNLLLGLYVIYTGNWGFW